MNKKDIYMAGPWVTKKEEKIVLDAVRNGWYGAKAYYYVEKFEYEFAKYHNRKYALMTPNCTTALHLVLNALGVCEKDEEKGQLKKKNYFLYCVHDSFTELHRILSNNNFSFFKR